MMWYVYVLYMYICIELIFSVKFQIQDHVIYTVLWFVVCFMGICMCMYVVYVYI